MFYTRICDELLRISLGRVDGGHDGPQISIEYDRGMLERFCLDSLGRVASSGEQISAMELNGEVGIFEEMSG